MCYWANCTLWQVQTKRQMTWYMFVGHADWWDWLLFFSVAVAFFSLSTDLHIFFNWFLYGFVSDLDFVCSLSNSIIIFGYCFDTAMILKWNVIINGFLWQLNIMVYVTCDIIHTFWRDQRREKKKKSVL